MPPFRLSRRRQLVGDLKLPGVQSRVQPILLEQVSVPPLLHQLAMIHHQDDVGGKNRREPVRDDERGPTHEERPQIGRAHV